MGNLSTATETHLKGVIDVATAYLSNHAVSPENLPELLRSISRELQAASGHHERGVNIATLDQAIQNNGHRFAHLSRDPAVPVTESVTEDAIICLFDGKPMTMLKRYIRAKYGMEEADYKAFWNLPADYPMVAPGYSKQKSLVAIGQGLGSTIDKTPRARRAA